MAQLTRCLDVCVHCQQQQQLLHSWKERDQCSHSTADRATSQHLTDRALWRHHWQQSSARQCAVLGMRTALPPHLINIQPHHTNSVQHRTKMINLEQLKESRCQERQITSLHEWWRCCMLLDENTQTRAHTNYAGQRLKFHLARLDSTRHVRLCRASRASRDERVERDELCSSNMADDERSCTSLVVFMLLHTQILFVSSNKIN